MAEVPYRRELNRPPLVPLERAIRAVAAVAVMLLLAALVVAADMRYGSHHPQSVSAWVSWAAHHKPIDLSGR